MTTKDLSPLDPAATWKHRLEGSWVFIWAINIVYALFRDSILAHHKCRAHRSPYLTQAQSLARSRFFVFEMRMSIHMYR